LFSSDFFSSGVLIENIALEEDDDFVLDGIGASDDSSESGTASSVFRASGFRLDAPCRVKMGL